MYSLLAMATHIFANIKALEQQVSDDHSYLSQTGHVRQIRIPGDVIIGGVFPVHAKANSPDQPCGVITETRGVHRVEAMLYALDMINSQRDFLRGYKLGALILDSCSNPAYALNQSLDFVRDLIGSNDASEYQCRDGSHPESRQVAKKNVAAVVGGSYSSVTVQIANLLRLFKIVQVSPASTNADLSDKSRFEYFARTVPSDNYQARAMIDIALHFNWTYVSLVYSADEYGELGAEAFKKEARKVNICIAIEERILNKKEALSESIDNLVKKLQPDKVVGARVVVLFVGTEYVPELMLQTSERMNLDNGHQKKKIIWLASEGWDRNNDAYTVGSRKAAAQGAIVLMLESKRVPSFEEYFLSLNPGNDKFERNKWLRELWQHKFNCEFGLPDGSTLNRCENQRQTRENFNPDDKVQFVIDAVFAIAHGLQAMKQSVCPNDTIETSWISRHSKMPHICSAMNLIDDLVGKKFRFSPEGDGPAHYTILNYQPSFRDKRAESDSGRSEYIEVGRWSEDQLELNDEKMFWKEGDVPISQCSMPCPLGYRKQLIKVDEICCWACGKCEDYEYLLNETTCVDCGEGRWPTRDRTDCFDLARKHLKHMRWSSWYSIVPAVFAVIGICSTVAVIIVYIRYTETPVVKASGRELSYILLVSMLMCYAMTFILISRPTPVICAIKRTGIGFAFSCLYAAMLVKTNRIARIFSQATRSAQRPSCISPISQVFLTGLLAGVQLFGSLIWLLIVPPGTRHDYPSRDQVVLTCNVPDHHFLYSLAYDAALIVLCTVYAVKTRKVPENFNETKFIGFSMYTTCVVWLSWIFFFFGTGSDFQIQTTSLCISISMSANVALVCIFSPKLWIILFEKHKNVRKQDGEYMLSRRSAISTHDENTATQYTALLAEQRRRGSTRSSHQSISSSAQDTFL
ncbi:putative metabotropic glutamate receptor mgl-1 [Toxocara canis]|uniref:Putative metabotropic glutamate receptor mgl-1 n=1 Tax=Toxocara canis TaxID=6265 RepID=A0A0B2VX55_TOXCA|nr:putative metabotropic glutamate receptor mgl-1 [Toxocara canis]